MIKKLFKEFPDTLKPQSLLLSKGDLLFKQGDGVANLYFIQKGKVKLVRNTLDGHAVVLHLGQQGESIAEASLFSDQYHCSAIADSPCEFYFVKKVDLLQLLQTHPEAMIDLLAILSRQVRDLRTINEIKNIRSAKERILTFIRTHADKNKVMRLDLSLKDLAQKIGLAHETFYRELKKLEDSGVLQRNSKQIKLL